VSPGRHRRPAASTAYPPPPPPVPLMPYYPQIAFPEVQAGDPAPSQRRYVHVDTLSSRNATVAAARYEDVVCTGSAKRAPGDTADPGIARNLATARALRALAAELEHRARQDVALAEEEQEAAAETAGAKRLRKLSQGVQAQNARLLSTAQIEKRYGEEAAARHDKRLQRRMKP